MNKWQYRCCHDNYPDPTIRTVIMLRHSFFVEKIVTFIVYFLSDYHLQRYCCQTCIQERRLEGSNSFFTTPYSACIILVLYSYFILDRRRLKLYPFLILNTWKLDLWYVLSQYYNNLWLFDKKEWNLSISENNLSHFVRVQFSFCTSFVLHTCLCYIRFCSVQKCSAFINKCSFWKKIVL